MFAGNMYGTSKAAVEAVRSKGEHFSQYIVDLYGTVIGVGRLEVLNKRVRLNAARIEFVIVFHSCCRYRYLLTTVLRNNLGTVYCLQHMGTGTYIIPFH